MTLLPPTGGPEQQTLSRPGNSLEREGHFTIKACGSGASAPEDTRGDAKQG